MLLQFTVENYKSFNEPTTFSMKATRLKEHPLHVVGGKNRALRGAAIYGKNGAGKSNLVLAMGFARDLVVRDTPVGRGIAVEPYALRSDGNRTSSFRWFFRHSGKIWQYGFSAEAAGVVNEYLYAREEGGGIERKWFERETSDGVVKMHFGEALRGAARSPLAKRLNFIKSNIRNRPEQLFLPFAIENSVKELTAPYDWFSDVLKIMRAETRFSNFIQHASEDQFLGFLGDFLKFADTGIVRLERGRTALKWENVFPTDFPTNMRADIESIVSKLPEGKSVLFTIEVAGDSSVVPLTFTRHENQLWQLQLRAIHRNSRGEEVAFPLEWESEGTQRLIHLVPMLYGHKKAPMVLVIDELDRRLHTHLTRKFVELALDCPQDSHNQLIFTIHDTNLLTNKLLRRDEIWLTDKIQGATQLTSLAEYDVRSDFVYEDAYHEGRFDGVPHFRGEKKLLSQLNVEGI